MVSKVNFALVLVVFYTVFGASTVFTEIRRTHYWRLRQNFRYFARVVGLHVTLGIVTLVGFLVYLVMPRWYTAGIAAATTGLPAALLTGKKYAFSRSSRLTDPFVLGRFIGISLASVGTLWLAIIADSQILLLVWIVLAVIFGIPSASRIQSNWRGKEGTSNDGGNAMNVIVCMIDDVRRDRMSLYGYNRDTTPFLDQLQNETYVFENCISAGVRSGHSIPSILTGAHASVHEYGRNIENLRLVSEEFEEAGYVTGAISGNPHINPDRFASRFSWFSYISAGKEFLFVIQRMFARGLARLNMGFLSTYYFLTDAAFIHELAKGFIKDQVNSDRSFFLYLNYMDVHDPYVRGQEVVSKFAAEHGKSVDTTDLANDVNPSEKPELWYSDEMRSWGYDEAIRYTNDQISDLYKFLESEGIRDKTIVLLTSDHGELLGEKSYWGHIDVPFNCLFEVPLIVDIPETTCSERVNDLISGAHLPALLLDIAGIEPSSAICNQWFQKTSFNELINGEKNNPVVIDFDPSSVRTKGYDHPALGKPVDTGTETEIISQRLLVGKSWKLYEVNNIRHFYQYDDAFLETPCDHSIPDRERIEMYQQLDQFNKFVGSPRRREDPYHDINDEEIRSQLDDLGYL